MTLAQAYDAAVSHHRQGRLREAEALYEAALRVSPSHFGCLHGLGVVRARQGRLHEAMDLLVRARQQNPRSAEASADLADTLVAMKRYSEALAGYEAALAINPELFHVYNNLGNALQALGRAEDALASYRKAIRLKPDFAEAHCNLGNSLQALSRHEQAIASYKQAIARKPGLATAHYNLGVGLYALGRLEEAIEAYRSALAVRPDYHEAYNNIGLVLHQLGRIAEAIDSYERAQAIKPDYAEAHFNEALSQLALGNYREGWLDYQWRWLNPSLALRRREFPVPLWLGQGDLAGKTILLHAEQGLGDTIQFARYVPLVAARGARVVLEVPAPLAALLRGLDGVSSVCVRDDPLPPFDTHCPLMSLPFAFETRLDNIPAQVPYLRPSPDRLAKWRLRANGGAAVGIAWTGNPKAPIDLVRSIPLHLLRPILDVPAIRFVALQNELRDGDREALKSMPRVTVLGDRLADFADTAAVVSALDLVITVDTSVAHLAGALGKAVWVLLPFSPDWRWLRDRDDSPWYPTARLFRQPARGDWASVIERVAAGLREFAG